jgi:hypothetical protein
MADAGVMRFKRASNVVESHYFHAHPWHLALRFRAANPHITAPDGMTVCRVTWLAGLAVPTSPSKFKKIGIELAIPGF